MTATQSAIVVSTAATALVESLHGALNATHQVGVNMAALYNAHNGEPEAIGADLWEAWSANPLDRSPARLLVDACNEANIPRKEASLILNATGIVSKQRISQLLAVVYDGDTSKNKNNADRKSGKAEVKTPLTQEQVDADMGPQSKDAPKLTPFEEASQPLHPAPTPATVDLVLAMIARLPATLTKADADKLARAIAAKVGA